jgi:hypothetical protein
MDIIRLKPDGTLPAASLVYKNRCVPEKTVVGSAEIAAQIAADLPQFPMEMIRDVMAYVADELCQRLLESGEMVMGDMLDRLASIDGQPVELPEIAPENKGLFIVDVALTSKNPVPKKNT